MMKRREYGIEITVNGQVVHKVIIDPHYEEKHGASVDDQIVLELVKQLDGELFEPEAIQPPYTYFVTEGMELNGKRYKLIWLLEDDQLYVGIVNAYRRK
jgi:hypothetical protein